MLWERGTEKKKPTRTQHLQRKMQKPTGMNKDTTEKRVKPSIQPPPSRPKRGRPEFPRRKREEMSHRNQVK